MAALIPAIGTCLSRMTGGEKRFAQRLESKLEADWLCWYPPFLSAKVSGSFNDFEIALTSLIGGDSAAADWTARSNWRSVTI